MKPKFTLTLKLIRKVALFVAALVVAGQVGYRLGERQMKLTEIDLKKFVVNTTSPQNQSIDFKLFWEVWDRLEKRYIDKSKLDAEKMVYGAISGMVNSLDDPYTVFLPPKENEEYKQDLDGAFEGIGAQLGAKDDRIVVVAPLKDHPAQKAGLKAGDWIVAVEGKETYGWTVLQAVAKIRGPKGTSVKLTIKREGIEKPWDVVVTRDTIVVKSVEWEAQIWDKQECQKDDCSTAAHIKLYRFGDRTNDEWNQVISEIRHTLLPKPNFAGVVLDLRNNPGGYLQSSIYVTSEFVKSGVIVVQENSDTTRETHSVNRMGNLLNVPLVVLINKGSASAAEIVAGALRDHNRAKLVGENTFGKGSIQTPEDLPGGSGLHITTAYWILPKGEKINGTGIAPDIKVKTKETSLMEATTSAALKLEDDPQLLKAIEELVK